MPMKKGNKEKMIYFSQEEWKIICERAEKANLRTGTYIRKIAVQGELKFYDMQQLNNLRMSFNRIGIEINQIAKVVNSTQSVYAKDIEDMQKSMKYFSGVMKNYLSELEPEILL